METVAATNWIALAVGVVALLVGNAITVGLFFLSAKRDAGSKAESLASELATIRQCGINTKAAVDKLTGDVWEELKDHSKRLGGAEQELAALKAVARRESRLRRGEAAEE